MRVILYDYVELGRAGHHELPENDKCRHISSVVLPRRLPETCFLSYYAVKNVTVMVGLWISVKMVQDGTCKETNINTSALMATNVNDNR